MAPTSDERREVARAMREVTDGEYDAMFIDEILCGILGDRCCRDGEFQISSKLILLRLADLIDPTCHLWPSHDGGFGCDRCFTGFPEMKAKTSYCPACGARVVTDDDD